MDEFERDSVTHWYGILEDRLLDFVRLVPPMESNLTVHSPQLAGIILEASGLLDSVFREISPDPATVRGKKKSADKLDIRDYQHLFSGHFDLPNYRSYVLVSPPHVRCPFKAWGRGGKLSWWTTYNKIKHNRIANLRNATLDLAIESMCALHQIISRAPDFARSVLRHHWFKSKMGSPGQALAMLGGDPSWGSIKFLVGTKLFLVGRGPEGGLPSRVQDFDLGDYWPDDPILDFFAK